MKNIFWIAGILGLSFWIVPALGQTQQPLYSTDKKQIEKKQSMLDERSDSAKQAITNPFAISQHRRNYILPITYVSRPNTVTIDDLTNENVDNIEAKYQISVKLPLYLNPQSTSGVYMGFTAKSYWQVYNSDTSKPFRATEYEPEVYYAWRNELTILGFKFNELQLGLNHQSNGRSNELSRSWNRLFATAVFSDEASFYYVKKSYRIPESEKETPDSPVGDDNPDITKYLGIIELGYGTSLGPVNLVGSLRNNLRTGDNKGSFELNATYPLTANYDLLLQYFNGYGDSLIDYNRHQQRIGLGVQLKFF
jgi:phospholipase A1